jgi:hypothetical protein
VGPEDAFAEWVYGKPREEVHDKWLALHAAAKRGPVVVTRTLPFDGATRFYSQVLQYG